MQSPWRRILNLVRGVPDPQAAPAKVPVRSAGDLGAERLRLSEGYAQGKVAGGVQRVVDYVLESRDWSLLLEVADAHLEGARAALGELRKAGLDEPRHVKQALIRVAEDRDARKALRRAQAGQARTAAFLDTLAGRDPLQALRAMHDFHHRSGGVATPELREAWGRALHASALPSVSIENGARAFQDHQATHADPDAVAAYELQRAARREGNREDAAEAARRTREARRRLAEEAQQRRRAAGEALLAATGMQDYLAFFPEARSLKRRVTFHVGPTNSGKTYGAMQALQAASSGVYLAPLRLLALEGYDRLADAGLAACLLTGDDEDRTAETPTHTASTIEMLDTTRHCAVAVIDEVQMLADRQRGWAWTRAVVGTAADHVILVGSADALPMVEHLCRMTGDILEVVEHRRMSRLSASDAVPLSELEPGDAVVAFSRADIFAIRDSLSARHSVAMLYGALSPEVRRNEAHRFRSGEADVLVATDAVGMGLNLPLRRVFLAAGSKFDGVRHRALKPSEIRQICGRAGRGSQPGTAGFIQGAGFRLGREEMQAVLDAVPEPSSVRCYVMPPLSAIRVAAAREGHERLPDLLRTLTGQAMATEDFQPADLSGVIQVAGRLQAVDLDLEDRVAFSQAPVQDADLDLLVSWAAAKSGGHLVEPPVPASPALRDLETASRQLTAWMWLGRRYPGTFAEAERAGALRAKVNQGIEDILRQRGRIEDVMPVLRTSSPDSAVPTRVP